MNYSLLLDIVVVAVLIISIRKGMRQGLVMLISGIVSLFAGIVGGRIFADATYKQIANSLFLPRVRESIAQAISGISFPQTGDATANLANSISEAVIRIAKDTKLPAFSTESLYSFFKNATEPIATTAQEFINASSTVIAERIAYVLMFVLGFLIIQGIMFFALRIVNVVAKLPMLNLVNRLVGGLIGCLSGVLALMVLLWVISVFVPSAKKEGGFLSDAVVQKTYIAKGIVSAYNKIIPMPYQSLSGTMINGVISYGTNLIKPAS